MSAALAEDYRRNATPPVWSGRPALCLFCSLGTGCGITRDVGPRGDARTSCNAVRLTATAIAQVEGRELNWVPIIVKGSSLYLYTSRNGP
jgi:hypothetical protein